MCLLSINMHVHIACHSYPEEHYGITYYKTQLLLDPQYNDCFLLASNSIL